MLVLALGGLGDRKIDQDFIKIAEDGGILYTINEKFNQSPVVPDNIEIPMIGNIFREHVGKTIDDLLPEIKFNTNN